MNEFVTVGDLYSISSFIIQWLVRCIKFHIIVNRTAAAARENNIFQDNVRGCRLITQWHNN